MAEPDTKELDALLASLNGSAERFQTLWFSFLGLTLYLAIAALATTHRDLLLRELQVLPLVNIKVQLLPFYVIAPLLYLVFHFYVLMMLVLLGRTAEPFERELRTTLPHKADQELYRARVENALFLQTLVGMRRERAGFDGILLASIALITIVFVPIATLILMQMMFLPYHSFAITWLHRILVLVDLGLIIIMTRRFFSLSDIDAPPSRLPNYFATFCLVAAILWLSFWEGRWAGEPWIGRRDFATTAGGVVFGLVPDRLQLPDETIVGETKLEETKKEIASRGGTDFVPTIKLDGRDLQAAVLSAADLRGVSLSRAAMQGADLGSARLDGARLKEADLQGADLNTARLQGADLSLAQLQGASLTKAQLQGADLYGAQFQGALLAGADLRGAALVHAQLQGAALNFAQLQGALLIGAQLQGADLYGAQFQGALLFVAHLQGASLQQAGLGATDLSGSSLWRTNQRAIPALGLEAPELADVRLFDRVFNARVDWRPTWRSNLELRQWNDQAYQELRQMMEPLAPGDRRDAALLLRISRLDCSNTDSTLASCDLSLPPPPEAAAWRKALEDAGVDDVSYVKALAAELKTLVCSRDDNAGFVLRGLSRKPEEFSLGVSRLAAAGPEAPALVDFIMSKDCPVSASLTDADKAKLLSIKQDATKQAAP